MSITTSASVGTSYGSLMPVNSLMMPARALAYRPLRSRFSHSSTLVLTCTRMKPPWGAIIARTSLRVVVVRRDRGTDGDAAVLGDFRRDVADAADVDVAVFLREAELAREVLADQVAVEDRDWPAAELEQLREQDVGDRAFAGAAEAGEEDREALAGAGRMAAAEFLHHAGVGEPVGDIGAEGEAIAELGAADVQRLLVFGHFVDGIVLVFVRRRRPSA